MQDIEEIYKEYFETVYKYLFCLTHNSDLSEELTQETFYRAVIKFLSSNDDLENNAVLKEEKVNLYKKMQKLDDLTREVMYLRITGELSFKEIGDILNKTENWARVTFYRGKTKIKEDKENG